jgi:hypothetical protein
MRVQDLVDVFVDSCLTKLVGISDSVFSYQAYIFFLVLRAYECHDSNDDDDGIIDLCLAICQE